MPGPVLVAVDEDAGVMRDVERELRDRYARHYRVMCLRSPREVLARLEELAAEGQQVALVLAGTAALGYDRKRATGSGASPAPARKARAADGVGQLGGPSDRRGDLRFDCPRLDRPLRGQAVRTIGRGFSSGDLEFAARVGGGAARLPAYDPRDWRVLVWPGL